MTGDVERERRERGREKMFFKYASIWNSLPGACFLLILVVGEFALKHYF